MIHNKWLPVKRCETDKPTITKSTETNHWSLVETDSAGQDWYDLLKASPPKTGSGWLNRTGSLVLGVLMVINISL